jgi:hypothetical protein
MMKHLCSLTVPVLLVTLFLASCASGSADKRVPELADEMCGCFEGFKKTVTAEELEVLKSVSSAAHPQEELTNAFRQMDTDKATAFAMKMKSLGEKDSPVFKCLEGFDRKHGKETTTDKKTLTEKLLARLQGMDCTVGAAMVNLSLGKNVAVR